MDMTSQVLEVMRFAKKTGRVYKKLIDQFMPLVVELAGFYFAKVRGGVRQVKMA